MPQPVRRYLRGKTVLLTGGTGFLGKVVVDRLLTCAPDIGRIYLLIRPQPHMRAYRLPPDNRELHRLLVQDEVLKVIVTKAERFQILVDTKDEAAFRSRLKELGILLE